MTAAAARDDASRVEARRLRAADFQRQNLIALQDALNDLLRCASEVDHADRLELKRTGQWQNYLIPNGSDEKARLSAAFAYKTIVRISDDEIRTMAHEVHTLCALVGYSNTAGRQQDDLLEAMRLEMQLNERVGLALRSIDD